MPKIILASTSPRRRELLSSLGIEFEVVPSLKEEVVDETLDFHEVVMDLAQLKSEDVATNYPNHLVLGFDTLVIYKDHILGKPKDRKDAKRMLSMLSGKSHVVMTGCSLTYKGKTTRFYDETVVHFNVLSDSEVETYLDTKEPFDKAGAYGIQGHAARFVNGIEGDYYTVMGMPISKLYNYLKLYRD